MKNLICGMAAVVLSMSFSSALRLHRRRRAEVYTLRYKFHPGETIRWEVEHRSMVRATVSRTTQTTETLSNSVNVWRVGKVQPDGTATFEHRVEWVDMRHKLTGRGEVHYDSRTDKKPPRGIRGCGQIGRRSAVGREDGRLRQSAETQGSEEESAGRAAASPESVRPTRIGSRFRLPQRAGGCRPYLVAAAGHRDSACPTE